MSTTAIPEQDINTCQNKIIPITQKTEHDIMTPPISPVNDSLSSNRPPGTARSSLKITAGQTGLPWLSRDAEAQGFSPIQHSPEELSLGSSVHTNSNNSRNSLNQVASPPPKFMARPRPASVIGLPTRKRTMQKHIYTMKDGLDPVKVLCKRLASWQVSVKYLISMFHSIKKVESNTGKGYRKIDSKFTIPTKIKDQFLSSNGVHDAWSAFRQYTRENSLIHQDFVDFIENEIIPTLDIMLKDIHAQMQSLKQDKNLRTATLWDCRKKADAAITRLNSEIYNTINGQEKAKTPFIIPKRDPLLTKYVVIRAIQDLYKQENRLHKNFLETQDTYRQFEQEKIINVYKQLFQTLEEYRIQHRLESLDGVTKVATIFNTIENDTEWLHFVRQHDSDLVKQTAAFKDEQSLDYPNASHPLLQPLIMGSLQRHYRKKWIESFYVLSPVGLLYRFKAEKNLWESPFKPELIMFIPQCTILINPAKRLLELKGKALGGLFGNKKLFELSASELNQLEHWIEVLDPIAIQQEGVVTHKLVPASQPVSDTRSIHSKVQAEDEPEAQSEIAKLGQADTSSVAAAVENSATHDMQPIVQGEDQHGSDEDNDLRDTVEYSTHAPIATENAAQNNAAQSTGTAIDNDYTIPIASVNNDTDIKNKSAGSNSRMPGGGPTREGSDVFWDSQ